MEGLQGTPEVKLAVETVQLIRSELEQGGARYTTLRAFALEGWVWLIGLMVATNRRQRAP